MSRPARRTVNRTGVAARQPSVTAPAQRWAAIVRIDEATVAWPSFDREDPIAGPQHTVGGLAALNRLHRSRS